MVGEHTWKIVRGDNLVWPNLSPERSNRKSISITRPRYTGASATVDLQIFISGQIVDGKTTPPFISVEICDLEKHGDRWQFWKCQLRLIT